METRHRGSGLDVEPVPVLFFNTDQEEHDAAGSFGGAYEYRVLFDEAFPSPVDIVVAESEHYANSSWGILSEVRRQGISIYERT